MQAGNLGIAIYRIILSTFLGIIIIVTGYVHLCLILSTISENFSGYEIDKIIATNLKNLEDLTTKPWIYLLLPGGFIVGEIFNIFGEFLLFYFYRFTHCGNERIAIYTKYDHERERLSFTKLDLKRAFELDNQFIYISEMLYATARFFSGFYLSLFIFFYIFFNLIFIKRNFDLKTKLISAYLSLSCLPIFILFVYPLIKKWIEDWIKTQKRKYIFIILIILFFRRFIFIS